jgi:hypothetical protein
MLNVNAGSCCCLLMILAVIAWVVWVTVRLSEKNSD